MKTGIVSKVDKKKQLLAEDIRGFASSCVEGDEIASTIGKDRFIKIKCHNDVEHVLVLGLWLYGASWGNGSLEFFAGVLDRVIRGNDLFDNWFMYKPRGSNLHFGLNKNVDNLKQLPLFSQSGQ